MSRYIIGRTAHRKALPVLVASTSNYVRNLSKNYNFELINLSEKP